MKPLSKTPLAFAGAVFFCLASLVSSSATIYYVAFGGSSTADYNFRPKNLAIQVGDTVIWTNAGGIHTVTGPANEPLCGSTQDVQACTNTFNTPGVFAYECLNHYFAPYYMTGQVSVAGAPLPPDVLTNAAWTNGMFVFKVMSTANQTNIVEAATNLAGPANWVSVETNVPATNVFLFTDTNAAGFSHRFYRVVEP